MCTSTERGVGHEGRRVFLCDKGRRKAVLIDLKKNGKLWEDFRDLMPVEQRRKEPRVSLEEVEANLRKRGKIA